MKVSVLIDFDKILVAIKEKGSYSQTQIFEKVCTAPFELDENVNLRLNLAFSAKDGTN
jgi:hypothetical protein